MINNLTQAKEAITFIFVINALLEWKINKKFVDEIVLGPNFYFSGL